MSKSKFKVSLIVRRRCLEKWTVYGARNREGGLAGGYLRWNRLPSPSWNQGRGGEQKKCFCCQSLLTLDEVDEQDGQDVEREPQEVEEGQGDEGGVGVQNVVLVNL